MSRPCSPYTHPAPGSVDSASQISFRVLSSSCLSCHCFWVTATPFLLPWSTEATIGIQLRLFHGPSLTMGPRRQRQARTQDYWPLGLGTFHCPHSLEGKSLDVLGRHSFPRGLGQSLSVSLLQGPKYGLYCWIFCKRIVAREINGHFYYFLNFNLPFK